MTRDEIEMWLKAVRLDEVQTSIVLSLIADLERNGTQLFNNGPHAIKPIAPDGYGGDFEMTAQKPEVYDGRLYTQPEVERMVREARIDEREVIATYNYRGMTFSEHTDWLVRFGRFQLNNDERIEALQKGES